MTDSDSLYHRLFSHPLMVEGLVREFVPEAMAAGLDFTRMELVNAKFHSRQGKRREGDVIWRLPTADGTDIYLYVLVEFQSTQVWTMAVRTQVYTGLLWQQIIEEKKLKRGDQLPPVLPIVLYTGDPRWEAPLAVTDLIALPHKSPLWPWQPAARYYLLDEGAFLKDDLARRHTLSTFSSRSLVAKLCRKVWGAARRPAGRGTEAGTAAGGSSSTQSPPPSPSPARRRWREPCQSLGRRHYLIALSAAWVSLAMCWAAATSSVFSPAWARSSAAVSAVFCAASVSSVRAPAPNSWHGLSSAASKPAPPRPTKQLMTW
jgi:hypothetical protein